ncbi:uncharacterized protein PpBr36_10650 [Pyricularia pennisetigena]|uniref:uncharacterized protein n=1 Tax=Pyricularia pennisetigena TaxID=1578925 RepID=UPI00114E8D87|nr:uncharacterized protein PpBr36_10650 [Pyricularia pennisetigena]TLS21180.1 hypothetical protein PpBr36_10650 [Pyricularia pennisetigena]
MAPFAGGTSFIAYPPLDMLLENVEIISEMEDAFRLMQSGKHAGKIVLSLQDGDDDIAKVPVLRNPKTATGLDPCSTYLLVGGLGGLGRSLALTLVESGARNIAFVSRSGLEKPAAKAVVDMLQAQPGGQLRGRQRLPKCLSAPPPVAGLKRLLAKPGHYTRRRRLDRDGTVGDLAKWESLGGIRESTFHALIKTIVDGSRSLAGGLHARVTVGLATRGAFPTAGIPVPDWLTDEARFGHLAALSLDDVTAAKSQDAATAGAKSASASLPARLAAAKTAQEALAAVVDSSRPMYRYGVDSLIAIEFRNWIQRDVKADIALFDFLEATPTIKFAEKVFSRTKLLRV